MSAGQGLKQDTMEGIPRVRCRVRLPLSLPDGGKVDALAISFVDLTDRGEHLALVFDTTSLTCRSGDNVPNVRMHSECLTGDVFGSARCDCGPQLQEAITVMADQGGVILYLRQEGRGIGLYNKLDAYCLQEKGHDTYTANRELSFQDDLRDYQVAAEMLMTLGITRVRLLTNNPDKVRQLTQYGICIVGIIGTGIHLTCHNQKYLMSKRCAGHSIDLPYLRGGVG